MLKKSFIGVIGLIFLDQIIKLLIAHYFFNSVVVLLPDILTFRPIQNIHLSWIASIFRFTPPIILMIFLQLLAMAIIFFSYHYLSYLWRKGVKLLNGMCIFFISGIACSFIDVVFWGGSLDFLLLFDWFTFDLKDVYLDIGIVFLLIFSLLYYFKVYLHMTKEERKQTGILQWIKTNKKTANTDGGVL